MDLEMREINRRSEQFTAGDSNESTAISIGDDDSKAKSSNAAAGAEDENPGSSCAIDIIDGKGSAIGENENYERVCRICHLSAKESGRTPADQLMELGCGCKGELGVAHSHCAEAWFRVRGIRLCEICGETAKNITGVGDTAGFMAEWNENRPAGTFSSSPDGNRRCLRGQPLCNFLMACLVIAFVLPWFFRVNML